MPLTQLSDAIGASHQALAAIIKGDVEPFLALYSDADDITIGNPFGPFAVGRDGTRAAGTRAACNYRDGEIASFDRIATHATDTLACVVEVERFSVRLAGAAEPASVAASGDQPVPARSRRLATRSPSRRPDCRDPVSRVSSRTRRPRAMSADLAFA